MDQAESRQLIRRATMNLLARREHSAKELIQKLTLRFPDNKALFHSVIQQLSDEGLQSDLRFAESYYRWRSAKGFGSEKIRMELEQKGVDDEIIHAAYSNTQIDWMELLQQEFEKKYQSAIDVSLEEKAKMIRFFQHRGFAHKQIHTLFKSTF